MSPPSLDPCWSKVSQAQAHFDTVYTEIRSFLDTGPYGVVIQADTEPDSWVVRGEALQEPNPSWSVVIGDCVHNLRSALDYLVWQLALLETDTPGDRLEYPITFDPDYFAKKGRPKLAGLPEAAIDRIEALQPYPGRYDWGDWLLILHDLDRFDKHRYLQVTAYVLQRLNLGLVTRDGTAQVDWEFQSGRFEHGQVLARVGFTRHGPNADIQMHPQMEFDIAFDEGQSAAGNKPVLPTLAECMAVVRRILREFEDFF